MLIIYFDQFQKHASFKVIVHEEFLTLNQAKLIELVSDDNLNATDEEMVYTACMRWLNSLPAARGKDFHLVLEHIRLPLLSAYFLHDKVREEPAFKECLKCQQLVQEALLYNLLKDRRNQVQNERTRARKSFRFLEAIVIIGGEDDSVVLRSVDAYFPSIDRWFPL